MSDDVAVRVGEGSTPTDAGLGGQAICPRCGFDTRSAIVHISDDDKKEYMRSILGERPFIKTYSMFEGQFGITFKDMTSDDSKKLVELFDAMPRGAAFMLTAVQFKLLFSCVSYTCGDKEVVIDLSEVFSKDAKDDSTPLDRAVAAYTKYFGGKSETLCGMMVNAYNSFTRLLTSVASGGLDKNF